MLTRIMYNMVYHEKQNNHTCRNAFLGYYIDIMGML